jgi:DNA primase
MISNKSHMADTQLIKDRLDIVALIREYVPLKKAGANWKAPCPFHHEKSPSFMVHPEKQIWHCFGCGKGGDVFSFIQQIEGVEFVDALKLLADRAGVKIDTFKSEAGSSERNRILEINEAAAVFFHRFLTELPAASAAREYLKKRGLKDETVKQWQIGFITDQWELLTQYLLKKGFGINDLVASGLTIRREGADIATGRGHYDRFRGRIMFPIWDVHGAVVGFTGRQLVENAEAGGKYVNTPQTICYDKSRVLYGLDKAKLEVKNKDLAVVVEGQMDVISCHQAGMTNVMAASGTALTGEQVRLIKRYTNNVAMAFDADAAGENAGKRGIEVALAAGLSVRVIQLPPGAGKDAAETLQKNPSDWFAAVEKAQNVMEWYIERTLARTDLNNPRQKQEAAEVLLAQATRIPYAVERDDWLKRISTALRIDQTIARDELKRLSKQPINQATPAVAATPAPAPQSLAVDQTTEGLATELWSLIAKFPQMYGEISESLKEEYLVGTTFVPLYEASQKLYTSIGQLELTALRQFFSIPNQENYLDVLELRPYRNFDTLTLAVATKEAQQILGRLKQAFTKKRRSAIQQELAAAEARHDGEAVNMLLQELKLL